MTKPLNPIGPHVTPALDALRGIDGDLTNAERIALAQVYATLAGVEEMRLIHDRIDSLDSAVCDLHETLRSR